MVRWVAAALALLVALPALAGNVWLELSSQQALVGEALTLRVRTTDGAPVNEPTLAMPKGLQLYYRGRENSIESVQGMLSPVTTHVYQLTPLVAGEYELGPFDVNIRNEGIKQTNTVALRVSERQVDPNQSEMWITEGFGVERLWEGQTVVYRTAFNARVPVHRVEWFFPEFKGFREPKHGNGIQFNERVGDPPVLVDTALIPLVATGAGEIDLAPPRVMAHLLVDSERPGFFRRTKTEQVFGGVVRLDVKRLPKSPSGYSGLVGKFAMRAEAKSRKAKVGDSVSLQVVVMGDGTLEGFEPPDLDVPDGIRVYKEDQQATGRVDRATATYQARGVYSYSLVPTKPGTLDLGELSVVYFDPALGDFQTLRIQLGKLEVTGTAEQAPEMESFAQEPPPEAELPEAPTLRPASEGWVASTPPLALGLPVLWGLLSLPVFGLGATLFGGWARRRVEAARLASQDDDEPSGRAVMAALPEGREPRLAALDGALRAALAWRAGIPVAKLERQLIVELLPEPIREEVVAVTRELDRARFAGTAAEARLEERIREVVEYLERDR